MLADLEHKSAPQARPPASLRQGYGGGTGVPASERVGGSGGAKPPGESERAQRVSHASGAGIMGVPASERVGGSGGAKPPG